MEENLQSLKDSLTTKCESDKEAQKQDLNQQCTKITEKAVNDLTKMAD